MKQYFNLFLIISIFLFGWGVPGTLGQELQADSSKRLFNDPIHITADKFQSNHNDRFAEFSGHVNLTSGQLLLNADRLKIFYDALQSDKSESSNDKSNIDINKNSKKNKDAKLNQKTTVDKIVAEGNVQIHKEDITAIADQAIYIAKERKIVLSGNSPTITQGKSTISGSKITLYIDDNRFEVQGNADGQVKATIFPQEDKGLDQKIDKKSDDKSK